MIKSFNELELKIHNIDNKTLYSFELRINIQSKKDEIKYLKQNITNYNERIDQLKKELEQLEKELVIISKYLFNPDRSGIIYKRHSHIYK